MIAHEAESMKTEIHKSGVFHEILQENIAVSVVMKRRVSGIGSGDDVIEAMGQIYSFRATHDVWITMGGLLSQVLF